MFSGSSGPLTTAVPEALLETQWLGGAGQVQSLGQHRVLGELADVPGRLE